MKRNIVWIILAAVGGLLLGFLLFGDSGKESIDDHEHLSEQVGAEMWTCSMHPQILQPEPGDCPICGMDLIPVETSTGDLPENTFQLSENAIALADIQTTTVGLDKAEGGGLTLSGKIMENQEATSVQAAYFDGRIEKLNVNLEGDRISRGQLLATIYSPELVSAQQELLTAVKLKESQPTLYQAVRNKLKLWKLTDGQIDEIERTRQVREYFPIYATVSGIVTEKLVAEGDYMKQGQALFKVSNLSEVWAVFDAYEHQLPFLQTGQQVEITSVAVPNKKFTGKISFIDPILNNKTRTVNVRVTLNNKEQLLKPGMFVKGLIASIKDSGSTEAIVIPNSAIMWTGERSVVYVKIKDQPAFQMREVTLGAKVGDNTEVLDGLDTGDEIVTKGTFTVDAAAQLQGKQSMMNKSGEAFSTGHEGHSMETNSGNSAASPTSSKSIDITIPEGLISEYLAIKDALVAGEGKQAELAAERFLAVLKRTKTPTAKNEKWISWKGHIQHGAENIISAGDLEKQRQSFKPFSQQMIDGLDSFGNNLTVHKLYCPMADGNKGAFWLSLEKEIRNPYFGDKMLKCGEVVSSYN